MHILRFFFRPVTSCKYYISIHILFQSITINVKVEYFVRVRILVKLV